MCVIDTKSTMNKLLIYSQSVLGGKVGFRSIQLVSGVVHGVACVNVNMHTYIEIEINHSNAHPNQSSHLHVYF